VDKLGGVVATVDLTHYPADKLDDIAARDGAAGPPRKAFRLCSFLWHLIRHFDTRNRIPGKFLLLMKPETPYSIRVSAKAKHVRFQVTLETGLEIVVPTWFRASRVPALIEKNSLWIERAFQKAKAFQGAIGLKPMWQIPEEISLPAIERSWSVVRRRDDHRTAVVVRETSDTTLSLQGPTEDAASCKTALNGWLTQKGKDHLIPWLKLISKRTGLSYSSVSIRQQKTRWGSCSSRGSISLNARLLFLPSELVTYVLVHELCHTKQLNHSRRFWQLVESYLPDYRHSERRLRHCGRNLQGWLAAPAARSSKN
jgi:hypothetical protein